MPGKLGQNQRMELSATDWARLAAFIDGEGCISIAAQNRPKQRHPKQHILEIYMGSIDPRLAAWCLHTFGVGHTFVRKAPKNSPRPFYCWLVTGVKAALLLQQCYTYLLLKQEQADIAFAFIALRTKNGRGVISEENYAQRVALKGQLSALKSKPVMEAVQ